MNETYLKCMMCQESQVLPISSDSLFEWRMSGKFCQDYFPDLSSDQRELLISGTCGACFDDMFSDDEECNGICMTASDIGLPEYGDTVAYAHPDCPEHSDG